MEQTVYSPLFGALTAFVVVVLIGPGIIRYLTKLKFGQNVRVDGPRRHLQKAGTPTMGGIMILIGLVFAALVLGKNSSHLLFALFITAAYGAIGFLDDLLIIVTRSSLGLKARQKLFGQIFIAVLVALYALSRDDIGTAVLIPFTETTIELPVVVYVLLTLGVMLGTTNA
ncbi:MAG: phospho-N-acetylmuramoyl-pentapeptide-transferase, partial [Limnochordia bacterium]